MVQQSRRPVQILIVFDDETTEIHNPVGQVNWQVYDNHKEGLIPGKTVESWEEFSLTWREGVVARL